MPAPRLPLSLAVAGAVLVGVLTALQARVNGQLGVSVGDGVVAAVISFASGLLIVAVVCAVTPGGRRGVAALRRGIRERSIPWWMLLGGAAGALTVATQGLAVGIIGVSLFTVGVVAGQAVSGLILDRTGYGPAGAVAVTVPRLLGAVLAVAAVAFALSGDTLAAVPLWMLVLPLLTGAGIAWQQATNGRLRARVGSPLTATLVNFIGGTAILAVGAGISVALSGAPTQFPTNPLLYLGGAIGVVYIVLSAAIVGSTGVLLLGLGAVVGQLATSVLIDALWPAIGSPGMLQAIVMITLALMSVIVVSLPWRRMLRR
ncbi:transporter family-2 protein [Microbacterium sp. SLBN-154]|uniref:DMT family transporter n=1 Tax=Microbacterium sp. SLBN-154 TaxID=2768458 RepID=UPI0011504734|nr:DMT family transporter [Microbacterium sp. SLBN-154]TQK20198.1 transporter family-2 protein [Microbacterium sp. SLBN-154]